MKAIIVEDEKTGLDNLVFKLRDNCPGVEIIATCSTGEEAIKAIENLRPQLLFLDIRLGSMTGFDVLDRLTRIDFEIIFTTAYDQYAIQAIKSSALDYLLKPFKDEELKNAVQKAWRTMAEKQERQGDRQIALPVEHGIRLLKYDDIVWCEADNNNAIIYLLNVSQALKIPRSLTDIYQKLPRQQFFRIHRSYVVNRYHIAEFSREGWVKLTNKKGLSVSKNNKEEFLAWLGAGV